MYLVVVSESMHVHKGPVYAHMCNCRGGLQPELKASGAKLMLQKLTYSRQNLYQFSCRDQKSCEMCEQHVPLMQMLVCMMQEAVHQRQASQA